MSHTKPSAEDSKPDGSFLKIDTTTRNKAGWVKAAQAKKMKLADWVNEELNQAAKEQLGNRLD